MKELPKDLKLALRNYCQNQCNYTYTYDKIIDYIEPKNLKNETLKAKMIMNDLFICRCFVEKHQREQAKKQLDFIKNTLLNF